MHNIENKIEFKESFTLVVGNMIGAGIFMLPISLSAYGSISILGWIISGIISICLASVFKKLSREYPGESGPFTYTRKYFGEFTAFLVVWGYWISILLLNASLAIAITSYSTVFLPILKNQYYNISFSSFIIIIISTISLSGIKGIVRFQFYTALIKLIPLILIIFLGFLFMNVEYFYPINISNETDFRAITITTTLTFFAFLGLESATVPDNKVQNAKENVSKSTIYGVIFTFFVYLLSSIALFGLLSPALGCLNGWTLLQIELTKNLSKNNLFPKIFLKENANSIPSSGLIISNTIVVLLIVINYSKDLSNIFTELILTSTFCALILYFLIALGEILKIFENKKNLKSNFISIPLFLFLIWIFVGIGFNSILLGLALFSLSMPIYFYQKYYARNRKS